MPKIKDIPKIERPREKIEKYGPGKLSNAELLAILLRTGTKGINVVELSKRILTKFPKNTLSKAGFKELKNTFGLGKAKAAEIMACFELGRRLLKDKPHKLILSPQDVHREMKNYRNHKQEHFVVFFLDSRSGEIASQVVSVGTLNASLVHPREVFEPAINCSAAQIIVAHNHPSGDAEPSEDDLAVTRRLVEAGKLLGIEVIDHVIVAKDDFASLKERNLAGLT
ncbi:MAG TPA: DNA repair protein RadC [Candidatus Saccharimonadales bacterium]|nr:DNA repair protein RadC [Candidatus Saccharimonadales bacterium]